MHRTIKLSYTASDAGFQEVLTELRRRQSRAIRSAYCKLVGGVGLKRLYQTMRAHPVGQGFNTWLLLSGISKARALFESQPDGAAVFGGRKWLIARTKGKITADEWKAKRLSPLVVEGHARSFGSQGGNHFVTLDALRTRLIFHTPAGADYELQLKLSGRSRTYRKRLEDLQMRCETLRDTPFSITLTGTDVCISWESKRSELPFEGNPTSVLALDLNPSRIGWAVVAKAADNQCRCTAWGIFEFSGLNPDLKRAACESKEASTDNKRRYELAVLAKKIARVARHYGAQAVVTEDLKIATKDHGRGRWFNRLVNRYWFRSAFLRPLLHRLDGERIRHALVNPAYSSMIGNKLWANSMNIPDPACAALELGRRFLFPIRFTPDTRIHPPKPNAGHQRKDARRVDEQSAALGKWKRVWSNLNPWARDTPRRPRRFLRGDLLSAVSRRPSIRELHSHVWQFDPRSGTSDLFGFDFNLLLSG